MSCHRTFDTYVWKRCWLDNVQKVYTIVIFDNRNWWSRPKPYRHGIRNDKIKTYVWYPPKGSDYIQFRDTIEIETNLSFTILAMANRCTSSRYCLLCSEVIEVYLWVYCWPQSTVVGSKTSIHIPVQWPRIHIWISRISGALIIAIMIIPCIFRSHRKLLHHCETKR